jgi:hypothetical protein
MSRLVIKSIGEEGEGRGGLKELNKVFQLNRREAKNFLLFLAACST